MSDITVESENQLPVVKAQGGFDGASRLSRELALWTVRNQSADGALLRDKDTLDARTADLERNDAYIHGALQTSKDSVVGTQFRLNSRPDWKHLGLDETWAEEFQEFVESRFTLYAESKNNWIDVRQMVGFTELVRMALGMAFLTGEQVATVEWLRDSGRPYSTAIQMIDPTRLSNPNGVADSDVLRKGVHRDRWGRPLRYSFREAVPGDPYSFDKQWRWKTIAARKPWGRKQVLHYFDAHRVDQSRGVSDLVSAMKGTRMASKYKDVVLQNAVLNATYAAAIESDLPSNEVFAALGVGEMGGEDFMTKAAANILAGIAAYSENANNLMLDGVKIPHLYPGTKLKLQNAGQPGGVGTDFEESLQRYTAAGLGMSFEEFSQNFTKTNYSSFRGASLLTHRRMMAKKKIVADGFASDIYGLWFEEAFNAGDLKDVLPRNAPSFYDKLNAEAYTNCTWLGASRGQVDELKETQAAIQRIKSGLSTWEKECARFGEDWRDVMRQLAREHKFIEKNSIPINLEANGSGSGTKDAGGGAADEAPKGEENKDPKPEDQSSEEDDSNQE